MFLSCVKFRTRMEAEGQMNHYTDIELSQNDSWVCDSNKGE